MSVTSMHVELASKMSANDSEIIYLPVGQIRGIKRQTIYNDDYYSFEGIPYAQPPIGELRFKAPLPANPWTGIRDCTDFQVKPIQKDPNTGLAIGSEDCLYLNVYVKQLKSLELLPVMFYIYGGGFNKGEATRYLYSPDYLMLANVVVVTFNYRLDSLDSELQVPGNAGLKDQVLALKWVKQYIKYFNGNNENITVFGSSAGAGSTHFLMSTPRTENLFQKAVCMSGSALNIWACQSSKDNAYRLAKFCGYQHENNDRLVLEFLKSLDAEKLVLHDLVQETNFGEELVFTPTIEPYRSDHCIIDKEPEAMMATAWGNRIPLIVGSVADEGLIMYNALKNQPEKLKVFQKEPEWFIRRIIKGKNTELYKKLIETHFDLKGPTENILEEFIKFYGYYLFHWGIQRFITSRLTYSKAPTYRYRFAFDSPTFNHFRTLFCGKDLKKGVAHAEELSYLWFSSASWKLDKNTLEFRIIKTMVDIFTSFCQTSDPNCFALQSTKWKPLDSSDNYLALLIDRNMKLDEIPEKDILSVWNKLFE
uniref:carboxylesterase n=1 Tax=Glossina brevipalpis TaxID=37001 RepID=A0A1A9W1E3_9MUSC